MTEQTDHETFDLVEQFITLESLLHRHFERKRRAKGPFGNPHKGQGRVLSLLKLQPKISQKELSFLLDMRPQSLGELLSKLELANYITRETSAEDRRVMIIQLTEAGKQAAEQIEQGNDHETVFDSLPEEEQLIFSQTMAKLITELETEMPEETRRGFRGGHGPECKGGGRHGFGRNHMEQFERRQRHNPMNFWSASIKSDCYYYDN